MRLSPCFRPCPKGFKRKSWHLMCILQLGLLTPCAGQLCQSLSLTQGPFVFGVWGCPWDGPRRERIVSQGDLRMAQLLERSVCASTHADCSGFEKAEAGIEVNGCSGGEVGAWSDAEHDIVTMGPMLAGDHCGAPGRRHLNPTFSACHQRRLAQREAVDHGHGNEAHKGFEFGLEHGTLHVMSVWVGAV